MFSSITPHNNEWNRKYTFTERGKGFLMDMKNGMAYFAWKFSEEEIQFYKCEQPLFEKFFSVTREMIQHEFDPYENVSFKSYSMEM